MTACMFNKSNIQCDSYIRVQVEHLKHKYYFNLCIEYYFCIIENL